MAEGEALRKYSAAISKGGAAIIAVLASFVVWKYFSTGTNPFEEHSAILSILIAATLAHLIFGFLMEYSERFLMFSFCICLVSGVVAIELILFVLFPQIWKLLLINVPVALLIALALFSFLLTKYFGSLGRQEPRGDVELQVA